jgi:twitching motility protein PilI
MANTLALSPFQWLQHIELLTKQRAKGLPRQLNVEKIWRGIGFRLGKTYLVTSINEICEVIPYTVRLAKVPGAKSWVKGLANIRGSLLPVIDLKDCLEGKPISIEKHTRMLIIEQEGITAGLLVDEVLGIKVFPEHKRDWNTPCKAAWIVPFADGLFTIEEITWTVFNMQKLAKNDLFLKAALSY